MTRMDEIQKLMHEEAKERAGPMDYASKLYDVQLDVHRRVNMILKAIRDKEYEDANKKGGA